MPRNEDTVPFDRPTTAPAVVCASTGVVPPSPAGPLALGDNTTMDGEGPRSCVVRTYGSDDDAPPPLEQPHKKRAGISVAALNQRQTRPWALSNDLSMGSNLSTIAAASSGTVRLLMRAPK